MEVLNKGAPHLRDSRNFDTKQECIFCKIIDGKIPSVNIWENDKFLVILDAFPTMKGQVLVIPKIHEEYLFDLSDEDYCGLMMVVKNISLAIKKAFGAQKIGLIVEGLEVPHVHVRLYPLIDSGFDFEGKKFSGEEMNCFAENIKGALESNI